MELIKKEYKKISEAFMRVKKDINLIQNNLEKNNKKQKKLELEIEKLKSIVSKNKNKSNEKKIIGNLISKKYHYDTCPFAKKIKEENKIKFKNTFEAEKNGFNKCICIEEK